MNIAQTFLIWLRELSVEKSKVEHIGLLYKVEVNKKMNEKNEALMQRAYLFYKNNVKGVSRYIVEVIYHCTAGKWANLGFIKKMHIMPYNKVVRINGLVVADYWMYRGRLYDTLSDVPEFVREERGRGFRDIGYQYLVLNEYTNYAAMKDGVPDVPTMDGVIERGRPLNSVGAHCAGNNSHTVGVALVGADPKKFTENQMDSAVVIGLAFKMYQNRIMYSPHNKYADKKCPLYDVKKIAKRIKKLVRGYQQSRKLVVDGIIGVNTLAMLEKDYK